jgi:hypothetical protein
MPSLLYTYLCSCACEYAESSVCSAHVHRDYQVRGWNKELSVYISKTGKTLCITMLG